MANNKENKEKKAVKDDARSVAPNDVTIQLQRLSDELAALRNEVAALKTADPAPAELPRPDIDAGDDDAKLKLIDRLTAPIDGAVTIGYAYRGNFEGLTSGHSGSHFVGGLSGILDIDDSQVARLAYALSSVPKVALMRALLKGGPQSAAQLAEKTTLTTGSLYHHLRELAHADVVETARRNQITLTERGLSTALVLFAQAQIPLPAKDAT